jgi:hypothetical protein
MTQEALKQMYQLLLTEPHAPTVCLQLEAIAREALAQPEQEPVAWGVFEGNLHDMFFTQSEAQEMARLKGSHAEVKPFYTHPPQRTWVGLTDDDDIDWEEGGNLRDLVKAIEAKLKEKNT